ncbi:methionine ABC transporter ATP-binding protein [Clostridium formicaceticum]|uniref:Methionine ABC transporter ATP-binding protein n=1 Tax=Clostridium formicaceticum TaxID=1497 RepID=A0AAC9WF21_9CLOT|nr:methionine ABC transporter ATP-binding protein [Clostridium formicaceticum]AOY75919.1 methionine ABC transporter ATP-binding protein [Clostridium formicaceticum]ARE86263.1 Methionine import ATP-binding protein MetN [Clostridium formicaceticum]
MISLENISVTFKAANQVVGAVREASLTIEKGEIFGIVGSSGAGKSTLLRTINLLEKPTSGAVVIDGTDITDFTGEELRKTRLKIGMIFQHFNLIRGKTVFDNIAFAMKAAEKSKEEIKDRVEKLLKIVGLSDKRDVYPSKLSGGQKQRVGIARALANEPQILLCDEPTSALDLETTKSILQLLKEINRNLGITIVLITHEMDVVKNICDRVAVMRKGEVVEIGSVYDVFATPKHAFTKKLVEHTFNLELPREIFKALKGKIMKIVYRGNSALEPILSQAAKKFDLDLNILHGKIEYIGNQSIGVLVVAFNGAAGDIEQGLDYIRENTDVTEVSYAS